MKISRISVSERLGNVSGKRLYTAWVYVFDKETRKHDTVFSLDGYGSALVGYRRALRMCAKVGLDASEVEAENEN